LVVFAINEVVRDGAVLNVYPERVELELEDG
jgi:hypothetical protein